MAQKIASKVIEKYGLILFEFDRADLKDRNQIIVNRVITRMGAVAVGHDEYRRTYRHHRQGGL